MSFLKWLLGILFDAGITAFRAYQADQNLKKLGYTEGQRDAAVAQIRAVDAAMAARAAVRDDAASVSADRDNRD